MQSAHSLVSPLGIGWGVGCLLAAACGPSTVHVEADAVCESLAPEHCTLPWPSNLFTTPDATTATGLRLAYTSEMIPGSENELPFDTTGWNRLDGFSIAPQILTVFAQAIDRTNLPPHTNYPASLADDSPTVIIDASTGERVAHFAEPDVQAAIAEPVMLYLRPARRLKGATRYVVALRNLSFEDGTPAPASPVFAALRDEVPTDNDAVEARRDAMEDVFATLTDAGIERDDLIVAWDFTTVSDELLYRNLLFMRDDALQRVGAEGLGCTIDLVVEPSGTFFRRIEGTFTVPSYMETPNTLSRLVRGPDGLPVFQENLEVGFIAVVADALGQPGAPPGRLITYGHGLMGSNEEVSYSGGRQITGDLGAVLVATKWLGMSEDDLPAVVRSIADVGQFDAVADRLHQGMINQLVLTRTMTGLCASDPAFQANGQLLFDPTQSYFIGISQGSIFGATVMALSTDIERGVLNVGAAFYELMIGRSVSFDQFEDQYDNWYVRRIDRALMTAIMQQLWDQTEAGTYLPYLRENPLPGTSVKKILYTVGKNDALVTNIASDMAARTAGFPLVTPALAPVWGLEERAAPYDGSGYVYYDAGDPEVPFGNRPPEEDGGIHGDLRKISAHMAQVDAFLRPGGQIVHTCDGPCDPE